MRAVICGAGIAGLTAAWWLDRCGWRVLVVERASSLRDGGYVLDFFGAGYTVAERMGLLPRLKAAHQEVAGLGYVDGAGCRRAGIGYGAFTEAVAGRVCRVLREDLVQALHEVLAGGVTLRFGHTVERVTQHADGVTVQLDDGTDVEADLLIGADGVYSRVRALSFGPQERYVRPLGLHIATYLFRDDVVRQALRGEFRLLAAPHRHAGGYPLSDGRVSAVFMHRVPSELSHDPRAALKETFGDLGWVVPRLLDACPDNPHYDLIAQTALPAWSAGRVVLLGDACQAVSLLAGQGASLAMAGAEELARQLGERAVPDALAAYEARLRPRIETVQRSARRSTPWFVPDSRLRLTIRHTVLRLAALPGTATLLRSAMAPTPQGDRPGKPAGSTP
jgi:2-polyprenyl-6-methoxyphenol hydroxylase-like FAD-dependent oxidoreductase